MTEPYRLTVVIVMTLLVLMIVIVVAREEIRLRSQRGIMSTPIDELSHIDATIAGLQAKRDALLMQQPPPLDPPRCPHCDEPLDTVYIEQTCESVETHEATWEGRANGWKIDWDKPTNTDSYDHVFQITCGECECVLPYGGDNVAEWITTEEVVPEETVEPVEGFNDAEVVELIRAANVAVNVYGAGDMTGAVDVLGRALERMNLRDTDAVPDENFF